MSVPSPAVKFETSTAVADSRNTLKPNSAVEGEAGSLFWSLLGLSSLEACLRKMTTYFSAFLKFDSIFVKLLSDSQILYFQPTVSKYVRFPINYYNINMRTNSCYSYP